MSAETATAAEGPAPARGEVADALRHVVPVIVALLPFGIVFGALARDASLGIAEAFGLSGAIYAGASQLVILQLVAAGTPLWSILLAVVAVNFRHVLYSASLGRRLQRFGTVQKALAFYLLVDPVFAAGEARARERPLTKRYYFVFAVLTYTSWLLATLAGFLFGALIGDQRALGIDVILPIYFLTLTLQFRRREGFLPVFAAAAGAAILVYLTIGSPWHVTLGGLVGIATAAILPPKTASAEGRHER